MPDLGGTLPLPGRAGGDAAAAILFVSAATNALDVFSATNSSPWTAENFGRDPAKVASLREYVAHAVALTFVTNGGGAYLARSWWPIIGAAAASAYMAGLYGRAVGRGTE